MNLVSIMDLKKAISVCLFYTYQLFLQSFVNRADLIKGDGEADK
jgi:hypothetical protein